MEGGEREALCVCVRESVRESVRERAVKRTMIKNEEGITRE